MDAARFDYEVDMWHKAQGPAKKPDYWPLEATVCDIPQAHSFKDVMILLPGQAVSLRVRHCEQCAFSLVEPTLATA